MSHRTRALVVFLGCLVWIGAVTPAGAQIDLADIIAGGDGTGTAPAGNIGMDPRNGNFTQALFGGRITPLDVEDDGVEPSPSESPFVDSVFFMGPPENYPPGDDPDTFFMPITQDQVAMQFPNLDGIATGWNPHMANGNAGGGAAGTFDVGGSNLGRGVGIHSSTGVTFDLVALRDAHGAENVGCFQTFWGMDGCGGDVILYAILSDEAEVVDVRTFNATQNSGELLQLEIPGDAVYLTLATGSNGPDGCDHGNFGVAEIVASCEPPVTESLAITPAEATLAPTAVLALTVRATDSLGLVTNVTAEATYDSDPAGVVSIDATGLVTALANGVATVTATFDGASAEATITVADVEFIDLGDVTAGGTGVGNADPSIVGINGDTGLFGTGRLSAGVPEADGFNPAPVIESDFIESVFIITQDTGMPINQDLVTFDFQVGDTAGGWELILKGREPGGADYLEFGVDADGNGIIFEDGVGVHAAQGITYNLEALRDEHGEDVVRYVSAVAGELTSERNGAGHVNTYMILSDENEIIDSRAFLDARNTGRFLQMEIPEGALYLTLAVGAAGDGIGSDHGGFGRARLTGAPVEPEIASIAVTPNPVVLNNGGIVQLAVAAVLGGDYAGVSAEVDPLDFTFETSDAGVAEVDETGLVSGEGNGNAVITVSLGDISVDVPVQVGTIIELSDMVGGGDGTGTAPPENVGIDPRNGLFTQILIGGHVYEVDPEGDGLNPSPVEESDFIDSVFFIGARDVGGPAPTPGGILEQEITQSGVVFEFPSEDGFGSSWNHILANLNGGGGAAPVLVGGVGYETGIGLHAAAGITFDLEVIRDEFGADAAATFSTQWGMDACGGNVNLYVILSNDDDGVILTETFNATQNSGSSLAIDIPSSVTYLTLATGSNGADGCDHGNFAEARLISGEVVECPEEGDTHCEGVEITSVSGPNAFGIYSVDVAATASDESGDEVRYTFSLLDAGGATITEIGPQPENTATFTARAGEYTVQVEVDDEVVCSDVADDAVCTTDLCLGDDCASGVGPFLRGDCNGDGRAIGQVTDAVFLLNYNFSGGPTPPCAAACDVNGDGRFAGAVTDAIFLLNFNFLGGPAPAAPFPNCGTSTLETDATLGCETPLAQCP